ncbi:Crp/Fnr family transcriptional regulator [Maribacter sp. 2210JD10-5]|uniref:Crp/Fnr family transcriptional regulator n=1 Tax=Maribacter sp. 2210JD10-5 TaxID=3386272 RepID=UPI0039BD7FC3
MNDLINKIESKITLNEVEKNHILSMDTPIFHKKKEILIRQGQIAEKLFYVKNGVLRSYSISTKGDDLTEEIISSSNLFTVFESFGENKPSKLFVETVTDCELIEIPKKEYLALFNKIKEWFMFCNHINGEYLKKSSNRISSLKNLSAKHRYDNFVSENLEIAKLVPIKHLASYLGIKPQSLSRIRKHRI